MKVKKNTISSFSSGVAIKTDGRDRKPLETFSQFNLGTNCTSIENQQHNPVNNKQIKLNVLSINQCRPRLNPMRSLIVSNSAFIVRRLSEIYILVTKNLFLSTRISGNVITVKFKAVGNHANIFVKLLLIL